MTTKFSFFTNKINGGKLQSGKKMNPIRTAPAHCDNSNDSGLGFDHHIDTSAYNGNNVRHIASSRYNFILLTLFSKMLHITNTYLCLFKPHTKFANYNNNNCLPLHNCIIYYK